MEETKKTNVEETTEVDVTEIPLEKTKKEKALGTAKKVGSCVWKAIKTATSVVGGIVIVAFAAGTAIGAAKKEEAISEIPVEPVKPIEPDNLNDETSEDPTIDVGLDV